MKLRIAHISTAKTWRGGEQQIVYLYEELVKLGVWQVIICAEGSELALYCKQQSWNYATAPKRGSFGLSFAKKIKDTCTKFEIALVHIHDSHAHNNAVLAASLFNLKLPMVLSRRVDFAVSDNFLSRWKYNYKSIKRIISVSHAVQEVLQPAIADAARLTVLHSGINLEKKAESQGTLRREFDIPAEIPLIGNVAALAPHKDYYTFLKTAASLRCVLQAKFLAIGDGPEKEKILDFAVKTGTDDIIFTGFRKDAKNLLAELGVLLVTSETEGLGTTLLDAFLAGVPVVATAAGGITEIVEDEVTGLLAPVKDHEKLTLQVLRILNEPGLKERLVKNAAEKIKEFSKEKMAARTLEVYREILSEP
jgi:glycosyltransferase involved in cell wall biosynthesis